MIPRETVEAESYTAQVKRLEIDLRDLDDYLSGLLFEIARIPESFHRVGNTGLRVAWFTGDPIMLVSFTFNDTHVTLLGIQRFPSS